MEESAGMTPSRFVYDFDEPSDGGRALLGGKGIGLAEMTLMGLPVPAGFTITTDACRAYMASHDLPDGLHQEVAEHVRRLEERTGRRFGDSGDPLLVSVRSGAAISMPGMMDTILNLGLNDAAAEGLAARTGNRRFAFDSYRRLVQMFGEVVDGIEGHRFEDALTALKRERGTAQDTDLTADDLEQLVETYRAIYRENKGGEFPQDATTQLLRAVRAVFDSWDTPRAQVYRRANEIPDDLGTAVNVVQMVFGNKGDRSGTGVAFTRNPSTGENEIYGEFLANAQGEDVVAGIRTPQPVEAMAGALPAAYEQLLETMRRLEERYRDAQDVEFTVEDDRLYMLQTRSAKRTTAAALRMAVDMVAEGLISREEAVARIDAGQLDQVLHPTIDPGAAPQADARGLNASPGAASGGIVFDADSAVERASAGPVILVRYATTPDDIHGMIAAEGILTVHGGMTSHAAVVARGMGKPCVAGCEELHIEGGVARIGGRELNEGDPITIDGSTGSVYVGEIPLVPPQLNEDFETVLGWADEHRRLKVRANADTPEDAARAREFGAEGIGLCRTEHMFFGEKRLPVVQEMILADSEGDRRAALDRLLPFQQSDFEGDLRGDGGAPGHDPIARPAAARVPAVGGPGDRREDARADPRSHRDEPDARHARLPPRADVPGDLRDADQGDCPGREGSPGPDGKRSAGRDHAPARRLRGGAAAPRGPDRAGVDGGGVWPCPPCRHDGRAPARLRPCRHDCRVRRVLLVRHERSDADRARRLAGRRRGQVPDAVPRRGRDPAQPVRDPRPARRRRADARSRSSEGAPRGPT